MNHSNTKLLSLVLLAWLPLTLLAGKTNDRLYGQWRIVSISDTLCAAADTGRHVFAGALRPTLWLDKTGYNGNTGCNRYSGTIERTGKHRVRLAPAVATRRYCPGVFDERRLLDALQRVEKLRRCGKKLTLKSADGKTVVKAVKMEIQP